ncbi:rRNA maturation RNase YbeY [Pedobacter sp. L105]|uniref:rRNA maturation RNase YbeY n=1 Tax=Pedobacter sp. L105 TaxID=1641871 RepID=UPI00131A9DE8|nr:rRNA maturation RNase YbeY [Pedobacter sp. L105]
MAKANINFFSEEVTYTLKNKLKVRNWINETIIAEGYQLEELNFILCSDEYLLAMNKQYLNHDTYTDVITFDNSEQLKTIMGDIFISIERIQENAQQFKSTVQHELCRVMVHGTLHLLGYKDKGKAAKTLMTQKEDQYLALLTTEKPVIS